VDAPDPVRTFGSRISAFVRFTRPHTMFGTAISVTSVSCLALRHLGDLVSAEFAGGLLAALASALAMNISIVGLNQLYDIDIDRINKPYLPLASGEFTVATGAAIVAGSAILSLAIGLATGSVPLLLTLVTSLTLGVAYSTDLPLLRWKRFPVLAATCILAVRAVIVQLGFFAHINTAVFKLDYYFWRGGLWWTNKALVFGTVFMTLFSVVIALFKDMPDTLGDEKAGLKTLSIRIGTEKVFQAGLAILGVAYAGAVAVGFTCTHGWSRVVTVTAHAGLVSLLAWKAREVDCRNPQALYTFYMFIWKLFYIEYALLPLIR